MSAAITSETKLRLNFTAPSYVVLRFYSIFIDAVTTGLHNTRRCIVVDLTQPLTAADETWISLLSNVWDTHLKDAGVETGFDFSRNKAGKAVAVRLYLKKLPGTRIKPDVLATANAQIVANLDGIEKALKAANINTEPPIVADKHITDL